MVDIDECQLNTDECDINASCNNTEGSYQCTCNSGYWGSGLNCTGKTYQFIHAETRLVTYHSFDLILFVFNTISKYQLNLWCIGTFLLVILPVIWPDTIDLGSLSVLNLSKILFVQKF